ncbi:MAG: YgiT-type zinc finger protein [Firmicutes bacterium]|nr:YgiT-type zinc finger protein [Bacillota bacterium]
MQCYRCGVKMVPEAVTFSLPTRYGPVPVDGVPAEVCPQCGERSFDISVVEVLEGIRDGLERAHEASPQRAPIGRVAYATR